MLIKLQSCTPGFVRKYFPNQNSSVVVDREQKFLFYLLENLVLINLVQPYNNLTLYHSEREEKRREEKRWVWYRDGRLMFCGSWVNGKQQGTSGDTETGPCGVTIFTTKTFEEGEKMGIFWVIFAIGAFGIGCYFLGKIIAYSNDEFFSPLSQEKQILLEKCYRIPDAPPANWSWTSKPIYSEKELLTKLEDLIKSREEKAFELGRKSVEEEKNELPKSSK